MDNNTRKVTWHNTNQLLKRGDCDGIKTGITPSAGGCLCTSWHRNDRHIIIVILRA